MLDREFGLTWVTCCTLKGAPITEPTDGCCWSPRPNSRNRRLASVVGTCERSVVRSDWDRESKTRHEISLTGREYYKQAMTRDPFFSPVPRCANFVWRVWGSQQEPPFAPQYLLVEDLPILPEVPVHYNTMLHRVMGGDGGIRGG